jgi:2-hydroxychromene-2-carboxylate isomerase
MRAEFLFDFGSPNAYLSHLVLPEIEARTGVKFDYIPILLGGVFKLTNNKPPMIAFGGIKNKLEYEQLETQRFIRRHNITRYKFNPDFPINTLVIMRAAAAAKENGELPAYVDAVFHHMWEAPKKMDDVDVIRAALTESGLDAERLLALAQTPEIKQRLLDNTEQAVACGVFGSPSFFAGDALFFGKNTLPEVEEQLVRRAA